MSELAQRHCVPCEGGTKPLSHIQSKEYLQELGTWHFIMEDSPAKNFPEKNLGGQAIEKTLQFNDFKEALAFVNAVGAIAEIEGHHPDISIFSWNKVKIRLSTHAIGGLSDNDFILAAKIDEIKN